MIVNSIARVDLTVKKQTVCEIVFWIFSTQKNKPYPLSDGAFNVFIYTHIIT